MKNIKLKRNIIFHSCIKLSSVFHSCIKFAELQMNVFINVEDHYCYDCIDNDEIMYNIVPNNKCDE